VEALGAAPAIVGLGASLLAATESVGIVGARLISGQHALVG
jgi:hypothetical protein